MTLLRFDNVSKRYAGREALGEVSFSVEPAEMLFVTGHSGAGKSTLLKLIHLTERATRGTVLFGDRNLGKLRGRRVAFHRREVGVVFQDHRLLSDRSVGENVGLPLVLRGMHRADIAKRVRSTLEKVGLAERAMALHLSQAVAHLAESAESRLEGPQIELLPQQEQPVDLGG